MSLAQLIEYAYGIDSYQLLGGPDWIRRDRFTVTAKYPTGWSLERNGRSEALQMLQALLADRFRLSVHRQTQEGMNYALVMAREDRRLGPKLRPDVEPCDVGSTRDAKANGRMPPCMILSSPRFLEVNGHQISFLAARLSAIVRAPVVDRTGLDGIYDAQLEWTPIGLAPNQPNTESVSLFTALEEQLGLKLEAKKGPVAVLVIDAAERPTPN